MKKKIELNRRKFIKVTGIGTAAFTMPFYIGCASIKKPRLGKIIPANRKLNIAIIGVGGRGKSHVKGLRNENIVALCDVDANRARKSFENSPNAKKFKDYRKMLKDMDDRIDAVTVATPDHMHFPAALMAIEMGKHVLVEKPLTHTIWEARELRKAAEKYKVITQMGNHGHANEGTRLVREWVQAGIIGPIREVHFWTNRPIWPQGMKRPKTTEPVPRTLDWNLWLGVAPLRPYHSSYAPFKWRGWWDFGCGALGDMACHIMDSAYWALDLKYPISVEAENSPVNKESAPKWSIVTYQFPARGKMPPVKLVWYDGIFDDGKLPPRPKHLEKDRQFIKPLQTDKEGKGVKRNCGAVLIGEKASILTDTYSKIVRIIPESAMQSIEKPPKTIPRIKRADHFQEWVRACKGGPKPGSNFDYSGPFTEMVLLGNLAIRSGKKIEWNGEEMKCTNVPEANKYLKKVYRKF